MSKGKDFRAPRKRGFDDDGPSPFDAPRGNAFRPRGAFDRQPVGGGFGGDAFGAAPPPATSANTIDAVVKWFKSDKGFGFVELGNGSGDAFLHIGALQSAGYETVPPGANSGQVLRLKGRGGIDEHGQRGDLFARLIITLPETPDETLLAFAREWREKRPYQPKRKV